MRLLALDTASALCSAAVLDGDRLLTREVPTPRDHATLLLPMVHGLLAQSGLALTDLDAVAFGRGPGSFTGLRVAASIAQGLALGAGLPVVPVSDLRALALQAAEALGSPARPVRVACCMDARMSEVYAAYFEFAGDGLPADAPERVCAPAALDAPAQPMDAVIGRGFEAYAEALASLRGPHTLVLAQAEPRACDIARLAAWDFAAVGGRDAAEALPVYLRDDVARPS